MADSLRRRISKRIANASLKSSSFERNESSPGPENSSDETKPRTLPDPQRESSPTQDTATVPSPPPPARKLRSSTDLCSLKTSPPQSMLDRYKKRAASPKMAKTHATYTVGKGTAFSENFDDDDSAAASEWVDVSDTPTPENASDEDLQDIVNGVKFEMMGKKGQAAEAPKTLADEEPFVYERRHTRSQSRRQQRADSVDSNGDARVEAKEDALVPTELTIKKVNDMETSRTPSPKAASKTDSYLTNSVAPTPSNSPSASTTTTQMLNTLVVDLTKNKAEYRLSNASSSPDPISREDKTVIRGLRRKLPEPPAPTIDTPPATTVAWPIYTPDINPNHLWCSSQPNTSRPQWPWTGTKKWTCCRCAHQDPDGIDRAAQTIVEQKVCSRLSCQHVRCERGCSLTSRDSTLDKVSPQWSP